jgi:Alpha galactosidase A
VGRSGRTNVHTVEYRPLIRKAEVKAVAAAFVASGLRDAGYKYIVVDDCWSNATRDASNTLVAQSSKFPSGMKSLGDYMHDKGLKFGMYATANPVTCCFEAGSYTYETKDSQAFAGWGVDYLKYHTAKIIRFLGNRLTPGVIIVRISFQMHNSVGVSKVCVLAQGSVLVPTVCHQ